jgi:cobalamin biosynthesis protein CbiD
VWPESDEAPHPLKTGLTTGCCATACSIAAAYHLLANTKITAADVTLPKNKVVQLTIIKLSEISSQCTRADVIKDAGDDPDATHGATVFVELSLSKQAGIKFKAAKGVGTVTRAGLSLAIGEPAINPVPRKMITEHLQHIAKKTHYHGGFIVAVGVENGEKIALKTMNARLGILGGLSILGVSGIVRPFSCSAYIASIYQGIDVATANGYRHLAATTGNRSEAAIKDYYQLPDIALIEMGDFVGAVISQVKKVQAGQKVTVMDKLTICGGFGKLSKLAMGKWNLHSQASSIDFNFLAQLAQNQGACASVMKKVTLANTSIEALTICFAAKIDLAAAVCQAAYEQVNAKLPAHTELDIWTIDRQGALIGYAGSAELTCFEHTCLEDSHIEGKQQ